MKKQGNHPAQVAAMVYASKAGGPRLYIGALAVTEGRDADSIREELLQKPLGEWFTDVDILVQNPSA